jgi:hypothetical protein
MRRTRTQSVALFAAAAEAMRRITLNRDRDKKRLKRGGDFRRIDLEKAEIALDSNEEDGVYTTRSKTSVCSNCSFRVAVPHPGVHDAGRKAISQLGVAGSAQAVEKDWPLLQSGRLDRPFGLCTRSILGCGRIHIETWRDSIKCVVPPFPFGTALDVDSSSTGHSTESAVSRPSPFPTHRPSASLGPFSADE